MVEELCQEPYDAGDRTVVANPVLAGAHPDPCLCRARGKYYLVTSTFQWMPGVSIYESIDLVRWRSLGGLLGDLDLRGIPDSAGIWAPDLTFDEMTGRFWLAYTVCKQIDGVFRDVENYVTTAQEIIGPWSKPVFINASGFDPGIFHENGRHYFINPQWDPRPLPGHHRFNGLIMQEFSVESGLIGMARTVLTNDDAVHDLREGPHVMKHDGRYYIVCAEGGTGRHHSIVVARADDLWGPYEVDPARPMLSSWGKDCSLRKAGHGNLLRDDAGAWYVCHLCARYLPGTEVSPLGRETAIQNVIWVDGWPRLACGDTAPIGSYVVADATVCAESADEDGTCAPDRFKCPGEPGYNYETAFTSATDLWCEEWLASRTLRDPAWTLTDGGLELRGGDSLTSLFDPALLVRRQTSTICRAQTTLSFKPTHYNQLAGLVWIYDTRAFVLLCVGFDEARDCRVIDVLACIDGALNMPLGGRQRIEVPDAVDEVTLIAHMNEPRLRFAVSLDAGPEQAVGASGAPLELDASCMSDERVAGWAYTGSMVGVACVDMFDKTAHARFASFSYEDIAPGLDKSGC
ncbi:Xylan 1,4-beta-xylosidase [Coriobacterium glomerans PW2]|uniref:Xylan 1,4-beta-xylosidase n=1 Tax=Coriobacterium glomerans (strain ATCC 49209 / DSM 20642 / JCM 10262 / PW2) TaxID=700015 RepID=F2NB22_CORGP|nr:family 43 glycosylhydrolase [Coriobacterium glomerans]AEB07773.1 Xylan 1,4-beta-xylosidase [Coriobacterium glomerans PW2]